jgi:transcriptional regulator with XRE-family HTH domain
MSDLKKSFGEKLKEIRKDKQMTLEEMASLLGTSKQVLSRYERGDRAPKFSVVAYIAKALDLPIGFFDEDEIEEESEPDDGAVDVSLMDYVAEKLIGIIDGESDHGEMFQALMMLSRLVLESMRLDETRICERSQCPEPSH